jgi:putative addiction module killer protein
MQPVIDVRRYVSRFGKDVLGDWLAGLDITARARVAARIDRISLGNFGDSKSLREGVSELRIDWGPGYRVYYAVISRECVLLLCGGDKRKQPSDIARAIAYLKDYKGRTRKP